MWALKWIKHLARAWLKMIKRNLAPLHVQETLTELLATLETMHGCISLDGIRMIVQMD